MIGIYLLTDRWPQRHDRWIGALERRRRFAIMAANVRAADGSLERGARVISRVLCKVSERVGIAVNGDGHYFGCACGRANVLFRHAALLAAARSVSLKSLPNGRRVTLHANTVVGNDGFGYATHQGTHHKIPQTGIVVIEDDVEIGASCAIERAAMGETKIGKGTKFADLISIGHATTIGAHCLLVSLVGISGSVEIGDHVAIAGQVGVTGHLRIGNGVQVAGKAAVTDNIPDGMKVGGVPAVELDQALRNALVGTDLYGLARRVRQLERKLERLQAEGEARDEGRGTRDEGNQEKR